MKNLQKDIVKSTNKRGTKSPRQGLKKEQKIQKHIDLYYNQKE